MTMLPDPTEDRTKERPRGLTVLVGGGFEFETTRLLTEVADDVDLHYLRVDMSGTPGVNGIPAGPYVTVPMFATVTDQRRSRSAKAFAVTFWECLKHVRRERIDLVFGFGCSHMVPMLLAARLAGVRTLYVETVARADKLSVTGRIVYHLRLAHTFAVQWPELQRDWPRAKLGTVL